MEVDQTRAVSRFPSGKGLDGKGKVKGKGKSKDGNGKGKGKKGEKGKEQRQPDKNGYCGYCEMCKYHTSNAVGIRCKTCEKMVAGESWMNYYSITKMRIG